MRCEIIFKNIPEPTNYSMTIMKSTVVLSMLPAKYTTNQPTKVDFNKLYPHLNTLITTPLKKQIIRVRMSNVMHIHLSMNKYL